MISRSSPRFGAVRRISYGVAKRSSLLQITVARAGMRAPAAPAGYRASPPCLARALPQGQAHAAAAAFSVMAPAAAPAGAPDGSRAAATRQGEIFVTLARYRPALSLSRN